MKFVKINKTIGIMLCLTFMISQIHAEEISLEKAVEIAVKNNSDWKISQKNSEITALLKKKAKAVMQPTLNLTSGYLRTYNDDTSGGNSLSQDIFSNSLNLTQSIYNRKAFILLNEAKLSIKQSKYLESQTKNEITFTVEQIYYSLLKLQAKMQVQEEAILREKEQLKYAKNLMEIGRVIKTEVLRAEIGLEKAKQTLKITQNQFASLILEFNNILGVDQESSFVPIPEKNTGNDIDKIINEKFTVTEDIKKALDSRPDLKIIDLGLEIAKEEIELSRSDFYPVVTGSGSYSWLDSKPVLANDRWRLSVGLTWTFFDGGLTKTEVYEAKLEKNKLEEDKIKLQKNIVLTVKKIHLQLRDIISLLKIMKKNVELSEENYKLVKSQYQNGIVSNLTLIDAEVVYTEAKINLLETYYDYKIKFAELKKTTYLKVSESLENQINN